MATESISLIFGIVGSLATIGCLYYAWKNDQLYKLIPEDKEVKKVFKENINKEGFIQKLHNVLRLRVTAKSQLRSALSIAKQMHFAKPMDNALLEIHKRAIELNDLKFAYHVATNAYFAITLDEMLLNIVNESLKKGDIGFANKAANRMHFAVNLDEAKKRIIGCCGIQT